jgi:DNA-binding NarL/FixJ family response regulator
MTAFDIPNADVRAGIRIAVVDDHELLSHTLVKALRDSGYDATAVTPAYGMEVAAELAAIQATIVLLDLDLGPFGSSLSLIPQLRDHGMTVVMLTGESSRVRCGECVLAGADAVVSKAIAFDELIDRISRVVSNDAALPREQDELRSCARDHQRAEERRREPFERLTEREREVLRLLMQGIGADEIATQLFVSLTTVRAHIRAVLAKLGVGSQLAAVAAAVRCGWH